eukprot:scaffold5325_cov183-Amphora_coffeaeformis.AAC.3
MVHLPRAGTKRDFSQSSCRLLFPDRCTRERKGGASTVDLRLPLRLAHLRYASLSLLKHK